MKQCKEVGCDGKVEARGWCQKHYFRWRRHGSPDGGHYHQFDKISDPADYKRYLRREDPPAREDIGKCHVWTRTRSKGGYGSVTIGGTWHLVHRLAWTLAHGPIPDDMYIIHRCDNPACARLDHLRLGTAKDNAHDRVRRHRSRRGSSRHGARLTDTDVKLIRWLYWMARGRHGTIAMLSRRFGVSHTTIKKIVTGKRWTHLPVLSCSD